MTTFLKRSALFALFLGYFFAAYSQEQKKSKLEEAIIYDQNAYAPERLRDLQWLYFDNYFSYTEGDTIYLKHVRFPKKNKAFSLTDLNQPENVFSFEANAPLDPNHPFGHPLKEIPPITWLDARNFYFTHENTFYVYDANKKILKRVFDFPAEAKNLNFEPHTYHLSYTIDGDLYIMDRDGTTYKAYGSEKPNVKNGDVLFNKQFGDQRTAFWSAKGERLAFYQVEYPEADASAPPFSMKGPAMPEIVRTDIPRIHIGVFSFETKGTIFLEEPLSVPYRINLSWGPEDHYLYVTAVNHDLNHLWLNEYDAETGQFVHTLFEESFEQPIEELQPMVFIPGNRVYNKKFIWLSHRDGHAHYYRYKINGELENQVTFGDGDVKELVGFSQDAIIVAGSSDNSLGIQLYSFQLRYPKRKQLTTAPGVHDALLSTNGRHIMDQYTSLNEPGILKLLDHNGEVERVILESSDPWKGQAHPQVSLEKIPTADKKSELNARLVLPATLEKGKKYPVLIYLGGSANEQLVTNDWQGKADIWMHYLADQDYIVYTVDDNNNGYGFDQSRFKAIGDEEIQNQITGLQHLLTKPYVDPNRIALLGKEFGGYLALRMIFEYPQQFTSAVVGEPILDWNHYDSIYLQRELGHAELQESVMQESEIKKKCDQLQAYLLLIIPKEDDPVQQRVTQNFLRDCQNDRIDIQLVDRDTIDRFLITKEAVKFILKHNQDRGTPTVVGR